MIRYFCDECEEELLPGALPSHGIVKLKHSYSIYSVPDNILPEPVICDKCQFEVLISFAIDESKRLGLEGHVLSMLHKLYPEGIPLA